MRHYFHLQYTMANRRFADAGIKPLWAYGLLAMVFVGLSVYLFQQTAFAPYIYALSAISLLSRLSDSKRNEFLQMCFADNRLKQIRITENLIITLPFVIFLTYQQQWVVICALIASALLLATFHFRATFQITIRTPFAKNPFEFTAGFRNTFYLILLAYILNFISIYTQNFNLGIFTILFIFAITLSYYTKPENEHFIWVHKQNASQFLLNKIRIATKYSFFLVLPMALSMGFLYQENIAMIFIFLIMGWAFLVLMIVSKYATYPDELNIIQGIMFALCIWFPPLMLILIPYLFRQSQKRISHLLA